VVGGAGIEPATLAL